MHFQQAITTAHNRILQVMDDNLIELYNGSQGFDNESICLGLHGVHHSSIVLGLIVFEFIGTSLSMLFLMATIVYLSCVERLETKFQFLQLQVCLTLLLSEISVLFGFLMSPCEPLAVPDESFVSVCTFFSAMQIFSTLSSFSWIFLVGLHVCRLIAIECHSELMRQQNEGTTRRLTLDERAIKDKVSTISREGLHRKISRDLLELWKTNIKPLYDNELAEAERIEEKTYKSVWYIETFSSAKLPLWSNFLIGYIPPAVLAGLAVVCQPRVEYPIPFQDWEVIEGLDMFCWPGLKSQMLWFVVGYLPLLLLGTFYFRYKGTQMLRILSGGPITSVKALSRWQRQKSVQEESPEIESRYMEPTAIQLMVVTFTTVIGFLQTFYVWGLLIPYSVLTFFKGFVFFLHHVLWKTDIHSKYWQRISSRFKRKLNDE